jgi:HK97 family phage major capsid protein
MIANTNAAVAPEEIELKSGEENDAVDMVTKALEDLNASVDERIAGLEAKLEKFGENDNHANDNEKKLFDKIEKLEARLNRPGAPAIIAHRDDGGKVETKAFVDYLRRGQIDTKALSIASNGGVLVPPVLLNEIQRNLVEISPIRSIARATSISGQKVALPKRTAGSQGAWVSETANRSESSSTYGAPQEIEAYEYAGYVDASLQVLEDAMFDLQTEIVRDIAEDLAKEEGKAFTIGDGSGKPTGFLHSPAVGSIVNATTVDGGMPSADDFIDAFYSLPSAYARNAVWVLNRAVMGAVRKMKTDNGDYIWAASPGSNSLAFANAGTILGAPVVEVPDAPSLAASTVVATVGDFKEAYRIVDRVGVDRLDVTFDNLTVRTSGKVRWHFRRRVGGEVVNANALRFLKTTAES